MKSEKSYKLLDKIENIGVVLRPQSPELKDIFSKIEDLFLKKNINLLLENNSAKMIDKDGVDFDTLCKK